MNELFNKFKSICLELNKIKIIPTLIGSLGFEFITKVSWYPQDIDIHVSGDPRGWDAPDDERIKNWDKIKSVMLNLGYELNDLHEHKFRKKDIIVEYGSIDSLYDFAGVSENNLAIIELEEIKFRVPNLEQYLKIYEASSKD